MLFDKLFLHPTDKQALRVNQKTFTYGELVAESRKRARFFQQHHQHRFLLCHPDSLENLLNFLAILYVGKSAVFGNNKSRNLNQLSVIDFTPTLCPAPFAEHPVQAPNEFLGILHPHQPTIIWKDYQSWFSAFEVQSEVFQIQSNDHILVVDALAYSANLNALLHGLYIGATVSLTALVNHKNWANFCEQYHVSSVFMIPSHLELLIQGSRFFSKIKSVVTAGEKVSAPLSSALQRAFRKACITEYYGAAELGHVSYLQNQEIGLEENAVGRAFPQVEIRIQNQQIWVESPFVSPQYRSNPTINDLGYLSIDGQLFLLGKEGTIFKRRSPNPYALELNSQEITDRISHLILPKIYQPSLVEEEEAQQQQEVEVTNIGTQQSPLLGTDLFNGKINFKILSKKPVEEEHNKAA